MKKYFRDIFQGIWSVLIGMKVTFLHLFTPAVTIQYPDVKLKLPERARNRLYVNMDDCIGCFQCDIACPVDCFAIETAKALPTEDLGTTSTGQKKKLWVTKFDIDIAKCCYCGLCVYPCPTECIKMTDVYEFSEFDRHQLIYNYATLTPAEIADVKVRTGEYEKEQAVKKAAAATAAAQAKAASAAAPGTAPAAAKPAMAPPATAQATATVAPGAPKEAPPPTSPTEPSL
ncbi:MAG: NADH-quinone oxidoreductase subunit I [Ignavibacteriae bacterium]|nr:NADH-quinone oxidoreductase subunit I [Ignavibacteria bacterium]MBI3363961.1 NADH-quinone oxidoreductase subunit I [Ignavibacteriota bacterium]